MSKGSKRKIFIDQKLETKVLTPKIYNKLDLRKNEV
jgi:hypothetical protein